MTTNQIGRLLSAFAVWVVMAAPASGQLYEIFGDTFNDYPAGGTPQAFLDVWPLDGCDAGRITTDGYSGNAVLQGKDLGDGHCLGVRHRHDLTPEEIQAMPGAPPNANAVQGTNDSYLKLTYYLDLGAIGWFEHNRFMELTCGPDRAPTPMLTMVCTENGKVRRYLNPDGDGQTHGSIAVGVIAMADDTPCGDPLVTGDESHEVFWLVVYDGREWHILKDYPAAGTNIHTCKRWNKIYLYIYEDTMTVELNSKYNPATGACDSSTTMSTTIPRAYFGPFTSVVMGGIPDEEYGGCIEEGSPGTNIPSNNYTDILEDVHLAGGVAIYDENPCLVQIVGACCVRDGFGTGTCSRVPQTDCPEVPGVQHYLGDDTVCGPDNENCYFCPDPFADADEDGDVDQEDFGVFQTCFTGLGPRLIPEECACFNQNTVANEPDIDEDDWGAFEACASGPDVAANPACDD